MVSFEKAYEPCFESHLEHNKGVHLESMYADSKNLETRHTRSFEPSYDRNYEVTYERNFEVSFTRNFTSDRSKNYEPSYDRNLEKSYERNFEQKYDRAFEPIYNRNYEQSYDNNLESKDTHILEEEHVMNHDLFKEINLVQVDTSLVFRDHSNAVRQDEDCWYDYKIGVDDDFTKEQFDFDLPLGWEHLKMDNGKDYFADHCNRTTHWDSPMMTGTQVEATGGEHKGKTGSLVKIKRKTRAKTEWNIKGHFANFTLDVKNMKVTYLNQKNRQGGENPPEYKKVTWVLPPGWRSAIDSKSRRVYYINDLTHKTIWTAPTRICNIEWHEENGTAAQRKLHRHSKAKEAKRLQEGERARQQREKRDRVRNNTAAARQARADLHNEKLQRKQDVQNLQRNRQSEIARRDEERTQDVARGHQNRLSSARQREQERQQDRQERQDEVRKNRVGADQESRNRQEEAQRKATEREAETQRRAEEKRRRQADINKQRDAERLALEEETRQRKEAEKARREATAREKARRAEEARQRKEELRKKREQEEREAQLRRDKEHQRRQGQEEERMKKVRQADHRMLALRALQASSLGIKTDRNIFCETVTRITGQQFTLQAAAAVTVGSMVSKNDEFRDYEIVEGRAIAKRQWQRLNGYGFQRKKLMNAMEVFNTAEEVIAALEAEDAAEKDRERQRLASQQQQVQMTQFGQARPWSHQLPEGWEPKRDPRNRKLYFINHHTKQTTYDQPLPPGWEGKYAGAKVYYINHQTKATQWTDPRQPIQGI